MERRYKVQATVQGNTVTVLWVCASVDLGYVHKALLERESFDLQGSVQPWSAVPVVVATLSMQPLQRGLCVHCYHG